MGKLIGRGAFGRVRLIIDKESKQQYAMKIITKPVTEVEQTRAVDWKAEVELNALVDSEYVVKIIEWYDTEEEVMLIMEFCENGNLADYALHLRKEGRKPSEYVCCCFLFLYFLTIPLTYLPFHYDL
jgi:serine/threonine protein kinase